jgi:sigma-E factor negative regulatory protein RseB
MRIPVALIGGLLVVMLQTTAVRAGTGNEAMDWVQKMSNAMQEMSYQGRFVYLHNGQLESMSVVHVRDGQDVRERLMSLNGEAREILRDKNNLTCVWPSSQQVVVDPVSSANRSPLWIPDDVRRLDKFYQFVVQGKDRIADHPAVIVAILPRDEFRYGMKVWVSEQHGLLLQSILFDEKGGLSEQIMFTELALLDSDHLPTFNILPELAQGYALIRSHSGTDNGHEPGDRRWQLSAIPRGFHIESSFQKRMPDNDHVVQQMVLSDGLASVSVFIEKLVDQSMLGESSMGAINAFTTQYKGFSVTAIGEAPPVTVRTIAEAVVFNP